MRPPHVYNTGIHKYTLCFDRRNVAISNSIGNTVGSIQTLFPGYTKFTLKEGDTHYERTYTPKKITKVETMNTCSSRVIKKTTDYFEHTQKYMSTIVTMHHDDIGGMGCIIC
jgi:hypothetical protein